MNRPNYCNYYRIKYSLQVQQEAEKQAQVKA